MRLPLGFGPDETRRLTTGTSFRQPRRGEIPAHRRLPSTIDPDEIIHVLIRELETRKADIRRLTRANRALQAHISTVTVSTHIHAPESALSPP